MASPDAMRTEPPAWSRVYGQDMDELEEVEEEEKLTPTNRVRPIVTWCPEISAEWKDPSSYLVVDKLFFVAHHYFAALIRLLNCKPAVSNPDDKKGPGNSTDPQACTSLELIGTCLVPDRPILPGSLNSDIHKCHLTFKTCEIYRTEDKNVIVFAQQPLAADEIFDWVDEFFSRIKPSRTVIFDALSQSQYESDWPQDSPLTFVRSLCTSASSPTSNVVLESPNLLAGLSAGVLSYLEVKGMDAELVLLIYNDHAAYNVFLSISEILKQNAADVVPNEVGLKLSQQTAKKWWSKYMLNQSSSSLKDETLVYGSLFL